VIQSYRGSSGYWKPVQKKLSAYAAARSGSTDPGRALALAALEAAIQKWRQHKDTLKSWNELDENKDSAVTRLEELMAPEKAASAVSQTPLVSTTQQTTPLVSTTQQTTPLVSTEAIRIGAGLGGPSAATKGSKSFQDALAETPDTSNLGLVAAVQQHEVEKVDQSKCKVQVAGDGTLRTWDEKHLIDSGKGTIRYVLTVEDGDLDLWASQSFVDTTPDREYGNAR
jgi:hypothetical protein